MPFIEIVTLELTGGHIEIILFIAIETLVRFHGDHIEIMLFIEIENIELRGGHIEIMLFLEIEHLELDSTAAILKLYYF